MMKKKKETTTFDHMMALVVIVAISSFAGFGYFSFRPSTITIFFSYVFTSVTSMFLILLYAGFCGMKKKLEEKNK